MSVSKFSHHRKVNGWLRTPEKHDLGDVDQPTFNKLFQRIEYYRTTQLMDPMKTASMSVKQKNHGRGIMETGDGTFALTTYDEADEFYNRK